MIFKLAILNLLRHKRRTFITGTAIAVGLIFFILMDSLLQGWYGGTEKQYIDYDVASGRIVQKSWWDDKDRLPLTRSIENTIEITSLLEELDIDYTGRTDFYADLIFYKDPYPEDGVFPARVVAIDPSTDDKIFKLVDSMDHEHSQGEFLIEGNDGIIVGNSLADKLNIEVGHPIHLQFTSKMGYQEILDTYVIGIIKTSSHLVNLNGVFITMDTADFYLEMEGAVTGYSVKVPGTKGGAARLAKLEGRLSDQYQLLGYEEIAEDFVAMMDMEDSFISLFMFLIFIIAAVGVSNTMMMSIFDRRREIGMMRVQGYQDWKIILMFLIEAGGIGFIGAVIGLSLGALINIPLVNTGMNYGGLLQTEGDFVDFGGLVIDSYMKGVWTIKPFVAGGILAVLVSAFVAIFPTRRILKHDIPDNLRTE